MLSARLVLENGSIYRGYSFGFSKSTSGEVVFNTGMTGYARTLTDPSYKGQILTFTYPMLGNYGVPDINETQNGLLANFESDRVHVQGIIVADNSFQYNHWHSVEGLHEWLDEQQVPGIYGIDTRALTQELREHGTMLGKILVGNEKDTELFNPNKVNVVAQVSCEKPIQYGMKNTGPHIAVLDCGVKLNIIRNLLKRNCRVTRVPWNYDFLENNLDEKVHGVLISNGPGDPKIVKETIEITRKVLDKGIPTLGICLGSQIMALAIGGNTYKLKYGHRAQNQPVHMTDTPRGYITSQNHGFAVDMKSMPKGWNEWFVNLNDGTNEGFKHESKPFLAVQFHPEASPGPVDTEFLFDKFLGLIQ